MGNFELNLKQMIQFCNQFISSGFNSDIHIFFRIFLMIVKLTRQDLPCF